MSQPRPRDAQDEVAAEISPCGEPPPEHAWKRIYHNNKGVFLILLAQMTGSSMDAIARFLQLGGSGMHPFQVRLLLFHSSTCSYFYQLTVLTKDHLCANECHAPLELIIHVVDPRPGLSLWAKERSGITSPACLVWILWTLVPLL